MGLVGLGIITLALFYGLWHIQAEYQYTWLIRGYIVFLAYALGLRLGHIVGALWTLQNALTDLLEAINATL